MCSKDNVFFRKSILGPQSVIIELGCGTSGLPGMAIAPRVGRYIATDQSYVLKLLRRNLKENSLRLRTPSQQKEDLSAKLSRFRSMPETHIDFIELDWELSDLSSLLASVHDGIGNRLNAVLACDCIYNDTLIQPLVQTCAELCRQEQSDDPLSSMSKGPVCVIAQQLRSPEVFEGWLTEFHRRFHVWKLHDTLLDDGLKQDSGYVVHVGILRSSIS